MTEEAVRKVYDFPEPPAAEDEPPRPFVPLGHRAGRFFLIDATGQVREFTSRDLTALGLVDLCGMAPGSAWPIDAWLVRMAPAFDQKGEPTGEFSAKRAGAAVQALCRRAGLWDTMTPLRDAGIWPAEGGAALLAHRGDAIDEWRDGRLAATHPPGIRRDGAIYVAAPARLDGAPAGPAGAAAGARLVAHLDAWAWRGEGAAELAAGLVAAAMLGAAPDWRAHGAFAGEAGTGKSQLAEFIAAVLGPAGFVSNDFTEASIRQALTGQARALILDEAEADPAGGPSRAASAIGLIRRLSGGEGLKGHRGSAGGKAQGFTLVGTAFIFGINLPPFEPQDRSRFVALDLVGAAGGFERVIEAKAWARTEGAGIRARMLHLWPMFMATRQMVAAALLADRALGGREGDLFGVVLAARWLLDHDGPPTIGEAGALVGRVGHLIDGHLSDREESDALGCLTRAFTSSVRHWRGGEELTLGELVTRAVTDGLKSQAAESLPMHGLRLIEGDGLVWLAVANQHQALARIFAGSRWAAGGWKASLLRWPGARIGSAIRFSGVNQRNVQLRVDTLDLERQPPRPRQDDVAPDYDTTR